MLPFRSSCFIHLFYLASSYNPLWDSLLVSLQSLCNFFYGLRFLSRLLLSLLACFHLVIVACLISFALLSLIILFAVFVVILCYSSLSLFLVSRNNLMVNQLYNTNHIYIGVVYIIIGLIGGSFGFGLSIIIRLELALNGYCVASSLNYNSIITFHGLLMIFFMIMPILIGGFGNILIPILIGCNDMIFPRLNLFSLWLSFFSLILIILSLLIDSGSNAG